MSILLARFYYSLIILNQCYIPRRCVVSCEPEAFPFEPWKILKEWALLCSPNHKNSLTNVSKGHGSQRTITELSNFSSVNIKRFLFWFPKEIILYFFFSTRNKNNTLSIIKSIFPRLWTSKSARKREKEKKYFSVDF